MVLPTASLALQHFLRKCSVYIYEMKRKQKEIKIIIFLISHNFLSREIIFRVSYKSFFILKVIFHTIILFTWTFLETHILDLWTRWSTKNYCGQRGLILSYPFHLFNLGKVGKGRCKKKPHPPPTPELDGIRFFVVVFLRHKIAGNGLWQLFFFPVYLD